VYKAGIRNVNADALIRNPVVTTVMISSKEKQKIIFKEMHECHIGGHQGVQISADYISSQPLRTKRGILDFGGDF
jgi:hypothetical protein